MLWNSGFVLLYLQIVDWRKHCRLTFSAAPRPQPVCLNAWELSISLIRSDTSDDMSEALKRLLILTPSASHSKIMFGSIYGLPTQSADGAGSVTGSILCNCVLKLLFPVKSDIACLPYSFIMKGGVQLVTGLAGRRCRGKRVLGD